MYSRPLQDQGDLHEAGRRPDIGVRKVPSEHQKQAKENGCSHEPYDEEDEDEGYEPTVAISQFNALRPRT